MFSTTQPRELGRADLGQHSLDRPEHLVEAVVGCRRVEDVDDELGDERLLERRGEAFDELVREAADEAHRVGHEVAAAVVLEGPRRRVERLEEAVLHGDVARRSAR